MSSVCGVVHRVATHPPAARTAASILVAKIIRFVFIEHPPWLKR
jgi:hypothetical protein